MNCDVYKLCDKKSKNIKNIKIEKESKLNLFLMAELYFEWIIMINLCQKYFTLKLFIFMSTECVESILQNIVQNTAIILAILKPVVCYWNIFFSSSISRHKIKSSWWNTWKEIWKFWSQAVLMSLGTAASDIHIWLSFRWK